MVLIKVIFSEVKIRLYLTCYQSYLLNKCGKFKMFWFLDLCREHLCRGHCVLLLIICLPWKPVFCHFLKPEWTLSFSDSSILWLPHHYLISNFAHAQEFCLFFLNVLISIVHFTSWCFFPGQMLSPVILFFSHLMCVTYQGISAATYIPSISLSLPPDLPVPTVARITPGLLAHCASFLSLLFKGNSSMTFPLLCPLSSFTI